MAVKAKARAESKPGAKAKRSAPSRRKAAASKRAAPTRRVAKAVKPATKRATAKRKTAKRDRPVVAFKTGKFHVSHAADAFWDHGLREYFAYRDLGMVERTGGRVRAHVIRPSKPCDKPGDLHLHNLDFQMVYVLKGWARVHFDGIGEVRFEPGSCMYQEPGIRHRVLEYSDDYTVIEITVPADFETVSIAP
jgi:mannose-6-phosphate isomerase-like protein (cupin superfamily)